MTDLYVESLRWPAAKIDGKIFNAGWQNLTIREIAELVKAEVGDDVEIVTTPTDDMRSYHVSSEKIRRELGWEPQATRCADAVRELDRRVQGRQGAQFADRPALLQHQDDERPRCRPEAGGLNSMPTADLSVVIANRNHARLLPRALAAVLSQSVRPRRSSFSTTPRPTTASK